MNYLLIPVLIFILSVPIHAENIRVRLFSLDTVSYAGILSSSGKKTDINTQNSRDFRTLYLDNDLYEISTQNKKRLYQGALEILKQNNEFILILTCDLEDYTVGAIAGEADFENYQLESTKALAVLARTYAASHKKRHGFYDICDTSHCQQFKGFIRIRYDISKAANETKGLILNTKDTYYSKCCGGLIDEPGSVWNGRQGKVIKDNDGKNDYCTSYKYYRWEKPVKKWEIEDTLRAFTKNPDAEFIQISSKTPSGRAYELTFGRQNSLKLKAEDFLSEFGKRYNWARIPARPYQIERRGDEYVFRGFGQGHGCGMCVYGASVMAKEHKNFRDIIEHYFPGAKIIHI